MAFLSACEVELRFAAAIFDLDDPEIGIEPDFPPEPRLGVDRVDPFRRVHACEQPVDAGRKLGRQRLRRGAVERGATAISPNTALSFVPWD